ncbi:MAG: hypothetical protein GY710_27280 [Desulfobacteraceae bacterium]|nr:hypothetical protein [Desulfobacteraceae bacterium]
MKIKTFLLLMLIIGFLSTTAWARINLTTLSGQDSVQTTIYNSADLTLVRDSRTLNLAKGMNQIQFSWANTRIDPTSLSLSIKTPAKLATIVEMNYPPHTKDLGVWQILAQQPCQAKIDITYFTAGLTWKSFYMAQLSKDGTHMDLKGYVRVENHSGEDYPHSQTRLVVGKINILDEIAELAARSNPYGTPNLFPSAPSPDWAKGVRTLNMAAPAMEKTNGRLPRKIIKQGLSEYFLYTIQGTQTIKNGWAKRLLSFEAQEVPVQNKYSYEFERFGNQVVQMLTFKNNKENKLGLTPLPGGQIKVFKKLDDTGGLSFIGSDKSQYIPLGKKVELNLGQSQEIKIIPRIMEYKKTNIIFDAKGNVSGFDEIKQMEIQLSNFSKEPATLEIIRNLPDPHFKVSRIKGAGLFKKMDQDTLKFTNTLPAGSQTKIQYQVTTFKGERRWQ